MTRGRQQSLPLRRSAGSRAQVAKGLVRPAPLRSRRAKHLWICLYFNRLPLEVIADCKSPHAIVCENEHPIRILLCNDAAAEFGVQPGMRVNAALALIPELELVPRDVARERKALETLAAWASRYTPAVSIDADRALLLDVQASLALFGGLQALRRLITTELAAQSYRVTLSSAPTSVAALWLGRAGRADGHTDGAGDEPAPVQNGFAARLATLPVECFGWPDKTVQILAQMGVRTLGECMRLPRAGFARRIGVGRLGELDRALGLQPETRKFYRPPKYFRERLELPAESADAGLLLESAQILLRRLDAFLVAHQGGVEMLWIRLHHFDRPATLLRIGLVQAVVESSGLLELIRLRFFDLKFAAPVIALAFETRLVSSPAPGGADLFGNYADGGRQEIGLLERLRARLGADAVHGIRPVPEHRPESAWEAVSPLDGTGKSRHTGTRCDGFVLRRPLWMLDDPQRLRVVAGKPVFHDVLDLEGGPERIETGWWDGKDIRRDYYVARNRRGTRLWIFEDRRASHWYLHGLFG